MKVERNLKIPKKQWMKINGNSHLLRRLGSATSAPLPPAAACSPPDTWWNKSSAWPAPAGCLGCCCGGASWIIAKLYGCKLDGGGCGGASLSLTLVKTLMISSQLAETASGGWLARLGRSASSSLARLIPCRINLVIVLSLSMFFSYPGQISIPGLAQLLGSSSSYTILYIYTNKTYIDR